MPVLLKVAAEHADVAQFARLRRKHLLLQSLNATGIAETLALVNEGGGLALVLADFTSESLEAQRIPWSPRNLQDDHCVLEKAMTHFIVTMSSKTKFTVFAAWLGGCLLLAVAPPLYLWSSGQRALILGMPLAIAYWLVDAVLLVAGVAALMHVEQARGELGADDDNEDSH